MLMSFLSWLPSPAPSPNQTRTMLLPPIKRIVILLHAVILWTVSKAEASYCTDVQINKCKNAALTSKLGDLPGGGVCKPSTYVKYTHECAVSQYIPNMDYCCCMYEKKVFCCRYHYNWNYFRCNEDEDTIHELTPLPLAIEILIPAIVVPSFALLCFFFYCIKCCCCNDDDDDEGHTCDIFSRCRRRRRRRKKSATLRQNHYASAQDNQRSTLLPSVKDSSISNSSKASEKCDPLMDVKYPPIDRTQPTAPPYDPSRPPPPPCNFDNPPPYNPELYDPVYVTAQNVNGTNLPYIRSRNEFGQDVIYQPIVARAHIPLPVTKVPDNAQSTMPSEQIYDCNMSNCKNDDPDKR